MKVYVKSISGSPLMPTTPAKARHLLKTGNAKVVRRTPFTIKLTYITTEHAQSLTLGVDSGSDTIGISVANTKNEILYHSEVEIRNDITDKMTTRAKRRRDRRSRKCRYRKPRFDNRGNSKRTDRFAPTVNYKIQAHVREIELAKQLLPVSKIVIETGKFDPAAMINPNITNWVYRLKRLIQHQQLGRARNHGHVVPVRYSTVLLAVF